MAQTFWILDADTQQPIAFTTATAARSVLSATPELLDLTGQILAPRRQRALVLADTEHFAAALLADVQRRRDFDLLVPLPGQPAFRAQVPRDPRRTVPSPLGRLCHGEGALHDEARPGGKLLAVCGAIG